MQGVHNAEVHPQWQQQGHEYYRAIWVECAELLDHFGWKWWKKHAPDVDQVKLEIVDIWHFGLSDLIRDGRVDATLADEIVGLIGRNTPDFRTAVEALAARTLETPRFDVERFFDVVNALPMTLDELFEIYIGKNVLNRFRQAHGYKSGEYHKVWDGREDNEHLAEIVSTLDPERPDYPEQVLAELESRYPSNAA